MDNLSPEQRFDPYAHGLASGYDDLHTPFLGPPPRPAKTSPYRQKSTAKWNMPEAYIGENEYLRDTMQDWMFTANQTWYTERVMPWFVTDQIHVQWTEWEQNAHFMGVTPHQAMSSIVTQRRTIRKASMLRRGIAAEFENDFVSTAMGRTSFMASLAQMARAVQETANVEVLRALVGCHRYQQVYFRRHGILRDGDLDGYWARKVERFMIAQKETFGLEQLNVQVDKEQEQYDAKADVWILGREVMDYCSTVPPGKIFFDLGGQEAVDRINGRPQNGAAQAGTMGNVNSLQPTRMIADTPVFLAKSNVVDSVGQLDLLSRTTEIGIYNTMLCDRGTRNYANYQTAGRHIRVYDNDIDDWAEISLEEAIEHCFIWDERGRVEDPYAAVRGGQRSLREAESQANNDFLAYGGWENDAKQYARRNVEYVGDLDARWMTTAQLENAGLTLLNAIQRGSQTPGLLGTRFPLPNRASEDGIDVDYLTVNDDAAKNIFAAAINLLGADNLFVNTYEADLSMVEGKRGTGVTANKSSVVEDLYRTFVLRNYQAIRPTVELYGAGGNGGGAPGGGQGGGGGGGVRPQQFNRAEGGRGGAHNVVFGARGAAGGGEGAQPEGGNNPQPGGDGGQAVPEEEMAARIEAANQDFLANTLGSNVPASHRAQLDAIVADRAQTWQQRASAIQNLVLQCIAAGATAIGSPLRDEAGTKAWFLRRYTAHTGALAEIEAAAAQQQPAPAGRAAPVGAQQQQQRVAASAAPGVKYIPLGTPLPAGYQYASSHEASKTYAACPSSLRDFRYLTKVFDASAAAPAGGVAAQIGAGLSVRGRRPEQIGAPLRRELRPDEIAENAPLNKRFNNIDRRIYEIANGSAPELVKWLAILYLGAAFTKQRFLAFASHNIFVPCGFLLLRPHCTYRTRFGIKCASGGRSGYTFFGHSNMQIEHEAARKVGMMHYTAYLSAVVTQPKNVYVIEDLFCERYLGGMGTAFWTRAEYMAKGGNRTKKSIVCAMLPPKLPGNGKLEKKIDVRGQWYTEQVMGLVEGDRFVKYLYPGAGRMAQLAGWYDPVRKSRTVDQTTRSRRVEINFVCFQGVQFHWNTKVEDWGDVTIEQGHMGPKVYPGVGQVRNGLMRFVETPNYLQQANMRRW